MVNVIIIHGAYGHPEENWIPWLRKELEKSNFNVFVPKFPTPEGQDLDNWLNVFEDYKKYLDGDSVIVGHSIGCAFILSLLEKYKSKSAFLVAGFVGKLNIAYDEINKTFAEKEFDWERIKNNCKSIIVYNSDNDPYVPLEKGKEIAEKLGVDLKMVEGAGHFGTTAGYDEFPLLLEDIRKVIETYI